MKLYNKLDVDQLTQTSKQYLEPIHPSMAKFVGGVVTEDGTILELGLWEKEERQHTPALVKLYQHLTEQKKLPVYGRLRPIKPGKILIEIYINTDCIVWQQNIVQLVYICG